MPRSKKIEEVEIKESNKITPIQVASIKFDGDLVILDLNLPNGDKSSITEDGPFLPALNRVVTELCKRIANVK